MHTLYLAGPIDLVGADGQVWKTHLLHELGKYRQATGQLTSFDPAAPYGLFGEFAQHDRQRCEFIEAVNTTALIAASVFVCLLPSNKASVGTPIELDQAKRRHKTIFVLSDIPRTKSVYTANRVDEDLYVQRRPGDTLEQWMASAAERIAHTLSIQQPIMPGPRKGSLVLDSDTGLPNEESRG